MTKQEYLLTALKQSQVYINAKWVFELFTVVKDINIDENSREGYDYQLGVRDGKYHYALNGEWQPIIDSPTTDRPLFLVNEIVIIPSQEQLSQPYTRFPFKTTAGNLFVNHYLLVYTFGNRFPYQNSRISISKLEDMVAPLVVDADEQGKVPEDKISVQQAIAFSSACTSLSGFASINAPSATRYTMLPAPGIEEYRKSLYEKYKDKLHDPATIAEIDRLLVEYDKAHQMTDPDGGFYQDAKAFDVSRKKLFVSYGYEQPEIGDGQATYIQTSLAEGWEIDNLPIMINALRDGSYNRGAMTALGGEAVKFIFRIFATSRIVEEDCGTLLGIPYTLTKNNNKQYVGNTIILRNKQIKLTEENINEYIGETVMVRSPAFCKTGEANFCHTCMGEKLRESVDSLAALASSVGSQMLYVFMKKMHGVAMKSTKWKYKETIS